MKSCLQLEHTIIVICSFACAISSCSQQAPDSPDPIFDPLSSKKVEDPAYDVFDPDTHERASDSVNYRIEITSNNLPTVETSDSGQGSERLALVQTKQHLMSELNKIEATIISLKSAAVLDTEYYYTYFLREGVSPTLNSVEHYLRKTNPDKELIKRTFEVISLLGIEENSGSYFHIDLMTMAYNKHQAIFDEVFKEFDLEKQKYFNKGFEYWAEF